MNYRLIQYEFEIITTIDPFHWEKRFVKGLVEVDISCRSAPAKSRLSFISRITSHICSKYNYKSEELLNLKYEVVERI